LNDLAPLIFGGYLQLNEILAISLILGNDLAAARNLVTHRGR
jgi:hypothetical protein